MATLQKAYNALRTMSKVKVSHPRSGEVILVLGELHWRKLWEAPAEDTKHINTLVSIDADIFNGWTIERR